MNTFTETRQIQSNLKALLKKRGYSYDFLARELGVSLPTVKRTLSAPDITLNRLSKICNSLGVQLHEFLEISRTADGDLYCFTAEQELFFAKNPGYLYYLLALYGSRKTPADLEKICGLNKRSTYKYLAKLSEMKLIRMLPQNRVRVMITGLIGWSEDGLLGKSISNKRIQSMADGAMARNAPSLYTELSGRRLTEKQYEEMKEELRALTAKYRRISKVNMISRGSSELNGYRVLIVADQKIQDHYPEIRNLP